MKRKIIITMKTSRRLTTFCLTGALTLAASGGALASGNDAALQALFAQANYWHEKSHDELAMESLQKVLSVDANNTQALYLMALWSQQGGDMQAAAQWRARLAKAAPDSPGLQDLDNAKKMSQVPQGQLSLARQQARGGNIPGALATWRSMFNGNTPPAGLAAEYYLTMASDKSLYPQAISELRQYVAQHPQENAPRVALGKALTWREETRREGIALLEPMASGNKEADSGLRQALLWLGPQAGDEQYYDTRMQRHPQDSEVQNYFRERRSGQARGQGYANLNSGNTAAAKQQFEEVLQTNPQDADALAGMGYIAQRSGDYQAASQYLSRAADLGGDASATRRQQAADALFYGQLAQAQQAYKQGNISQALALSAPLAQQSGAQGASAKLFRADVLRHNKDLPQAEQTLRSLLNDDPQNAAARENLYYVLREQNKSAEAQAMLQTLPQSLRQKLQPRVVAGMPGDALRRQAQAQVSSGNPAGAIATLREGVARYPDDPWLRLDLARLLQKSGNGSEASSLMSAAYRPGASNSALYAAALFASENGAAAGADAAGAHSRRQPDQRYARFAPAGELQPAVGDGRKLPGAGQYHRRQQYPAGDGLHAAKSPGGRRQAGASAGRERRPDHRGLAGAQQYQQRRIRQCRGLRRSDRRPESGRADRRGAEPDQQSAAAGQQYADAAGEHSQWLCDQRSRPPARAGQLRCGV